MLLIAVVVQILCSGKGTTTNPKRMLVDVTKKVVGEGIYTSYED